MSPAHGPKDPLNLFGPHSLEARPDHRAVSKSGRDQSMREGEGGGKRPVCQVAFGWM